MSKTVPDSVGRHIAAALTEAVTNKHSFLDAVKLVRSNAGVSLDVARLLVSTLPLYGEDAALSAKLTNKFLDIVETPVAVADEFMAMSDQNDKLVAENADLKEKLNTMTADKLLMERRWRQEADIAQQTQTEVFKLNRVVGTCSAMLRNAGFDWDPSLPLTAGIDAVLAKVGGKSLRQIQTSLPWKGSYDVDFKANPQAHKDFAHALLHVLKAAGRLSIVIDAADHGPTDFSPQKVGPFLADFIICAVRMANTCPGNMIDLQDFVERRLQEKNS